MSSIILNHRAFFVFELFLKNNFFWKKLLVWNFMVLKSDYTVIVFLTFRPNCKTSNEIVNHRLIKNTKYMQSYS